jgi:hypothetical protein
VETGFEKYSPDFKVNFEEDHFNSIKQNNIYINIKGKTEDCNYLFVICFRNLAALNAIVSAGSFVFFKIQIEIQIFQ